MAAAEALIVLSLLGCDDSGAQCDFVRVGPERYETVEACRAASEPLLAASAEENYPTVVAVCSPESSVPRSFRRSFTSSHRFALRRAVSTIWSASSRA